MMTPFNPHRRAFFTRIAGTAGSVAIGAVAVTPALAQDMGENGMAIPSFFFSGYERRQREACENKLPECRPAVKAQMAFEKDISLLLPWLGLVIGAFVLLSYMRKKEKAKAAHRKMAQQHHVPGSFKKMGDNVGNERASTAEVDDRF